MYSVRGSALATLWSAFSASCRSTKAINCRNLNAVVALLPSRRLPENGRRSDGYFRFFPAVADRLLLHCKPNRLPIELLDRAIRKREMITACRRYPDLSLASHCSGDLRIILNKILQAGPFSLTRERPFGSKGSDQREPGGDCTRTGCISALGSPIWFRSPIPWARSRRID
jgi:hypothetical protein